MCSCCNKRFLRLVFSHLPLIVSYSIRAFTFSSIISIAVDFHSSGDLLLVAGEDKYMRFFKVDGEKNEKQLSVRLNDMSIQNAVFRNTYSSSIKGGSSGASEVVACGRKPFFYSYDTVSGNVAKIPGNLELCC